MKSSTTTTPTVSCWVDTRANIPGGYCRYLSNSSIVAALNVARELQKPTEGDVSINFLPRNVAVAPLPSFSCCAVWIDLSLFVPTSSDRPSFFCGWCVRKSFVPGRRRQDLLTRNSLAHTDVGCLGGGGEKQRRLRRLHHQPTLFVSYKHMIPT